MKHGIALCCGDTPEFTIEGSASQYTCRHCKKAAGGWSHNQQWIASLWNQKMHTCRWVDDDAQSGRRIEYNKPPELDAGSQWRYAELRYEFYPPYGNGYKLEWYFVLIQIPERDESKWLVSAEGWECIIDDSRCFHGPIQCRRWDGSEFVLQVPNLKSAKPVRFYLSRSWCTDGSWHYVLNVTAFNHKWDVKIRAILDAPK